ncbi:MAG: hypothetical protein NTY01_24070 [Verrucomicrobia bacterium]|nr:hypothetical protein [Verrucomicrobiota bacterium]
MPDREYPKWGDKRLKFGLPGLRFDLPLPSWITDPPDLTLKYKGRHTMQLPEDLDDLDSLGHNAADGTKQHEDTLPLKANRHLDVEPDAYSFSAARRQSKNAMEVVNNANRRLRSDRDNARSYLMFAKTALTPTLGKDPSAAWAAAGFSDEDLQVPSGEDNLILMLTTHQPWLVAHPTLEVADPRFNYTAARAGELLAAFAYTLKNTDTANNKLLGLEPATIAAKNAYKNQQLTEAALRRRLHGLHAELEQILDPLDPRWLAFGFDLPGGEKRPGPIAALTVQMLGSGNAMLTWTGSERATRFQIWRKSPTDPDFVLFARTQGETEKLLKGEPVGVELAYKVRGMNLYEGPFSDVVKVTVT